MGSGEIFKELKDAAKSGNLPPEVRDRLILLGITELFAKVEELETKTTQVYAFYRIAVFVSSLFTASLAALLWGVFTGQIEIMFK
jgi:hypothetical protein